MTLKTQKRVAAGVGILAGVLLLGAGVTHVFNSASSNTPAPVAVVQVAPVNHQSQSQPNQPSATEMKSVISGLVAKDKQGLESHNYIVNGLLTPFGSACNNDGTTDGAGYQGALTSISYDISKSGKEGKACVSHDASGQGHVVVKMATLSPPPVVSQDQQQVLSGLEASDRQRMGNKGITVNSLILPFGLSCQNDGTTDGTGYHGSNTSLAYEIVRNGQTGKACVAHDNVGTGSHVTLKMN